MLNSLKHTLRALLTVGAIGILSPALAQTTPSSVLPSGGGAALLKQIVAEYYARAAFGIALDHQARGLRDIAGLAEIIHEQAAGKAVRS